MNFAAHRVLPVWPELQAAYDEMDAQDGLFAYAVCRTRDGQSWEVHIRCEARFSALDGNTYRDRDTAVAAGESWLLKQKASRMSWLQELCDKMIEGSKRMQTDPDYRRYIQSMTH